MKTDNHRTPTDRATATLLDRTSVTMPRAVATQLTPVRSAVTPPLPLSPPFHPLKLPRNRQETEQFPKYACNAHAYSRRDLPSIKKPVPLLVRENQLDPTLTLSEEGEGLACWAGVGRGGSCPWTFLGVVKWSAE